MKKFIRVLGVSALMTATMAISASAADITLVKFACGAPEDDAITTGITSPEFTADEADGYELMSYGDMNEDSEKYKNPHTYELVFSATDGNTFPNAENIRVEGTGIESFVRKKTEDDGETLVVRVKAYPYYQMEAPEITTDDISSPDTKKISWDKNSGSNFEYIVTWTDMNGEDRSKRGTTSGSNISVSSYNKEATEKQKENDKVDSEVTGFAVRAIASSSGNPRVAPSPWAIAGIDPTGEFDITEYESWSELGMGKATGSIKSSNTGSSTNTAANTAGPGAGNAGAKNGWQGSGNNWYWYNNGTMLKDGWVNDGGNWYWMGTDGLMKAGWQRDGNLWYYMNENHDGTYGRMMSGWLDWNGSRYYLNTNHDGTFGCMMTGPQVINGVTYNFGSDGRLQQ